MAKTVELRRHTKNDDDVLTAEGVEAAVQIGRSLRPNSYQLAVSSGAQRATQALACVLAGLGETVKGGVIVEPGIRSDHEDRWREVAGQADGKDLDAFRAVDAAFVEEEAGVLAAGLKRVFDALGDGERALVFGHSPTNEAAVLGLTGEIIDPLGNGEGVLVVERDGEFAVERLPPT